MKLMKNQKMKNKTKRNETNRNNGNIFNATQIYTIKNYYANETNDTTIFGYKISEKKIRTHISSLSLP